VFHTNACAAYLMQCLECSRSIISEESVAPGDMDWSGTSKREVKDVRTVQNYERRSVLR